MDTSKKILKIEYNRTPCAFNQSIMMYVDDCGSLEVLIPDGRRYDFERGSEYLARILRDVGPVLGVDEYDTNTMIYRSLGHEESTTIGINGYGEVMPGFSWKFHQFDELHNVNFACCTNPDPDSVVGDKIGGECKTSKNHAKIVRCEKAYTGYHNSALNDAVFNVRGTNVVICVGTDYMDYKTTVSWIIIKKLAIGVPVKISTPFLRTNTKRPVFMYNNEQNGSDHREYAPFSRAHGPENRVNPEFECDFCDYTIQNTKGNVARRGIENAINHILAGTMDRNLRSLSYYDQKLFDKHKNSDIVVHVARHALAKGFLQVMYDLAKIAVDMEANCDIIVAANWLRHYNMCKIVHLDTMCERN
jgi:hypothetical protein